MISIKSVLLLLFAAPFFIMANGQETSKLPEEAKELQKRLATYQATNTSGSIFLHVDKTTYSPEETLWFKAYLLGDTSLAAKILYVRIVDEEKTIVAEEQFPMYDIRSHGNIALSPPEKKVRWVEGVVYKLQKTLFEGKYILFAYTDRMLALKDTAVFVQNFEIKRKIGQPLLAEASLIDSSQLKPGGQVQVLVKVKDANIPLQNITGEYQLLDGSKEIKYAKLKTNNAGETFISFAYPEKQKSDFLKLKILFTQQDDYAELTLKLPQHSAKIPAVETGPLQQYRIKLLQKDGKTSAIAYSLTNNGKCVLVLRSNEKILWTGEMDIAKGDSAILQIPTASYPKQWMSLAILRDEQVFAERFFASKLEDDYRMEIATEQQIYGNKAKVTVSLQVTDATGKPVNANLSVSVAEKNRMENLRQITSLIPGKSWPTILAHIRNEITTPLARKRGITGKIVHYKWTNGKPIQPTNKVTKQVQLLSIRGVEVAGKSFSPIIEKKIIKVNEADNSFFIPDSLLTTRKNQEWSIRIPKVPNFMHSFDYLVNWELSEIEFDNTLLNGQQLQPLEQIKAFSLSQNPKPNPFNFAGTNTLREVTIGGEQKVERRSVRETNCERYEKIVIGRSMVFRNNFYTLAWDDYGDEEVIFHFSCGRYKAIRSIRSITIPEEFNHVSHQTGSGHEDLRSTLYWEPNLLTDAQGKASFSFYTSALEGEFEIQAQGIDIYTLLPLTGKRSFNVKAVE
ncbi:MAG: hypothetical protein EOO42_06080 [Flavobacteriales bacterium]|nr:MAG: hypothetical protein EOO42_06080 [Flavobacteriales bacterium]